MTLDRAIPSNKIALLITLCGFVALFTVIQYSIVNKHVKKSKVLISVNDDNFQNAATLFLDVGNYTFEVNKRFLSFSIDSSQIWQPLTNPYLRDQLVINVVGHLSGGYLRLGGTYADKIVFKPSYNDFPPIPLSLDGDHCSTDKEFCLEFLRNKTSHVYLSAYNWIELNDFSIATGLKVLFDLNVLLRVSEEAESPWDTNNAELLMDFSFARGYKIDWELGNEPNSFKSTFGVELPAGRLAKDYKILRKVLRMYALYKDSVLVGPGVTNPHLTYKDDLKKAPEKFLKEFLDSGADLDVITWHQYYIGANATKDDFLDLSLYDSFRKSCKEMQDVITKSGYSSKQVWIGETGSAYGGGVIDLSTDFITSLLWLDKLGIAAQSGISVVVRQSLFKGNYKLIDPIFLKPFPDYWVCILHKKLVGRRVLKPRIESNKYDPLLRIYMHCSTEKSYPVYFGVNIGNFTQGVVFPINLNASYYSLSGYPNILSPKVMLNGEVLNLSTDGSLPPLTPIPVTTASPILIPPQSIFFLTVHFNISACS